jgi:hypothetical protein
MGFTLNTSIGGVPLKEQWETFEKGIDAIAGPWVKLQYTCEDWNSTDAVCNALMGRPIVSGLGTPVQYLFPHPCPESPNLACLDARCVGVAEIDARDNGRPRFKWGVISAHYGIPQRFDFQAQDPSQSQNSFTNDDAPGTPFLYAMQSIDFDVEVIKIPGSAYTFFQSPTFPCDVPVSKTVGVANMVFVRKLVPYLPYDKLFKKMNKLNANTFLGQPRGQIKFRRFRTRREIASDGTRTQEIELHYQWREFDHNKIHRPDKKVFDFILDTNGNYLYEYDDLTATLS